MEQNTKKQYYDILSRLEENLQYIDNNTANEMLNEIFEYKPVRLKWYLVKAQMLLKEGVPIDEIIEFLSDKCQSWYNYDSVDEYFVLLSVLAEKKGDILESKRYLYQLGRMQESFQEKTEVNTEVDAEKKKIVRKIERAEKVELQDIDKLIELYYITGNIYLYMLWQIVKRKIFAKQIEIREWVLHKSNVEYYYERLIEEKEGVFVVIETSEEDVEDCRLAVRALKMLGKKVILMKKPVEWEKNKDIFDALSASMQSMKQENGIWIGTTYSINGEEEGEDTRKYLLEYITKIYSTDGLLMIMSTGVLMDEIAMDKEVEPKLERLTEADADYLENNISVGRYGNYLAYVANIYKTTRADMEACLYKKPSCRFSIIIPCRNAGDTLYYTLKTCLNQTFQGKYEVIISDNSDMSLGEDTPAYQICKELNDDRIKYYRTPRNLSLTKNFEFAYLKSNGEFLISMGADDGILPWALKELDGIISEYPEKPIILWQEAFYKWADVENRVMPGEGKAILTTDSCYCKGSPKILTYQAQQIFQKSLSLYSYCYYLPQLYHNSGIRREYMATLYEKTGVLWGGLNQDISMVVTIANMEDELFFVDNLFTITGISKESIGANNRVGNSEVDQITLIKKMKSTLYQGTRVQGYIERLFPTVGTENGDLYACVLYANAIGVISDDILKNADWKGMYKRVITQLNKWDTLFDAKIHRIRYAISMRGNEMLQWFDDNFYNEALTPQPMAENFSSQGQELEKEGDFVRIGNQILEGKNISDIYKASLLLEKIFNQQIKDSEKEE